MIGAGYVSVVHEFERRFPPRPERVPSTRCAVGEWLADSKIDDDDSTFDVLLVVTELIANAVIHDGGDDVILRLEAAEDRSSVCVDVTSYAAARATPDARGNDAADYGRGLQIVNQLSDHWVTAQGARRVDNCRIPL